MVTPDPLTDYHDGDVIVVVVMIYLQAMALSSVSVVLSALALNTYRRDQQSHLAMTPVNRNNWRQNYRMFWNRVTGRRSRLSTPTHSQTPRFSIESGNNEAKLSYCRMEAEGIHACDCQADQCICRYEPCCFVCVLAC